MLVAPPSVYPDGDDDRALYGFPWFSQVGEALCRAFGTGPILAAQAGLTPFDAALPAGLTQRFEALGALAARATGSVHFHPDTTRPDRWIRLIYASAAGRDLRPATLEEMDSVPPRAVRVAADPIADAAIVDHGLRALTLAGGTVAGSLRVRARRDAVPVVADLDAGVLTLGAPDVPDAICTRYALPPLGGAGRLTGELSGLDGEGRLAFTRAILARLYR